MTTATRTATLRHSAIDSVRVSAFTVPTEQPEADGTLQWDSTTVVVAEPSAGGVSGLGFTYGPEACATMLRELLVPAVAGTDAMDVPGAWLRMVRRIRNTGRPGVASMAIAAMDTALWDLKARLLELPLAVLLGRVRDSVPLYGSGGFTTYTEGRLREQLSDWRARGFERVKIKIGQDDGTRVDRDLRRVEFARDVIGDRVELFVDANGGYGGKQAVRVARGLGDYDVRWFEEPVSSDDLAGLRTVREAVSIDVAAGEYGYDLPYFQAMCEARAVDVLQVDVSRCAGITEWMRAAAVAAAHGLDVSGHCAQSLHAHPACAVPNLRHLEYFHDHARVDRLLFDGVLEPDGGVLRPDLSRHGAGLDLKRADARRFER
jgi:L-alanine-DL-glutamate epimerase-like enolase superfamily enzyme